MTGRVFLVDVIERERERDVLEFQISNVLIKRIIIH